MTRKKTWVTTAGLAAALLLAALVEAQDPGGRRMRPSPQPADELSVQLRDVMKTPPGPGTEVVTLNARPGSVEERRAFEDLDRGMRRMKEDLARRRNVPTDIHRGIALWEAMTPEQRLAVVRPGQGDTSALVIPTWAVAAVAAAHLVYEVGKDYNWWATRTAASFSRRRMTDSELDLVIESQPYLSPTGLEPGALIPDSALDYRR